MKKEGTQKGTKDKKKELFVMQKCLTNIAALLVWAGPPRQPVETNYIIIHVYISKQAAMCIQ